MRMSLGVQDVLVSPLFRSLQVPPVHRTAFLVDSMRQHNELLLMEEVQDPVLNFSLLPAKLEYPIFKVIRCRSPEPVPEDRKSVV